MASFVPTSMDRLTQLLEQRLQWVQGNLPRGEPSFEQCSVFVKESSDKLAQFTLQAPIRVKKIINGAFSSIGWDAAKGKAVTRGISMKKLAECLEEILAELSNFNVQPVAPTAAEIADIGKAGARLWELDHNRLTPNEDFELDLQGEKSPNDHRDMADRPLFRFVDSKFLARPTFTSFLKLLDNYTAEEGLKEVVTAEEKAENNAFLNLCMDTAVMQYAHKYLVAIKKVPADRDAFLANLNQAWFGTYRRKVANDSSGFEHVFLGEREAEKVVGLHNWLQLRNEELSGRLNYKGKIRPRRRLPAGYPRDQLVTIQFEWAGQEKFISSSFVGTSPEFELALYSMCFFSGNEETTVQLGPHRVNIKAFSIKQPGGPYIGSAFPEEAEHNDDELNRAARVIQKPMIRRREGGR